MILNEIHASSVVELIKENTKRLKNGYAVESGSKHLIENYLGQDPTRLMFGSFVGDVLVGVCSIRKDYPVRGTAIVGNFFATPTDYNVIDKLKALDELYKYACDRNITKMYSSVRAERVNTQSQIPSRLCEYIKKYDTNGVLEYVPSGTKPSQDWMWVIMGSRVAPTDTIIREIRRR